MNKKRLLMLARHLDKVLDSRFDMNTWSCRTKGCALYHASKIPELRKAGLTMSGGWPKMRKSRNLGLCAACELFGISYKQSHFLFGIAGDVTAKEVAKTIRKFVRSKEE